MSVLFKTCSNPYIYPRREAVIFPHLLSVANAVRWRGGSQERSLRWMSWPLALTSLVLDAWHDCEAGAGIHLIKSIKREGWKVGRSLFSGLLCILG